MKSVVLFSKAAHIREYKYALALREYGKDYRLILIAYEVLVNYQFSDLFDDILIYGPSGKRTWIAKKFARLLHRFDLYGLYLNKVLRYIRRFTPDIIHCFCSYSHENVHFLMRNLDIPFIYDGQDFLGITFGIENISKKQRIIEKYCFENATGIIRKSSEYEIDFYRNLGYRITARELQFLPYCERKYFVNNRSKLSMQDGELHLVYTGHVSFDPKKRYQYFIPLGRILSKQKIHLHLYSGVFKDMHNQSDSRYVEYYLEQDKNNYFHLHCAPYEDLAREISIYDFGLSIHENFPMPLWSKDKMKTSIGNKFFGYLEAGLPIIVSDHIEYNRVLVLQYDIGFSIKDAELVNLSKVIKTKDIQQYQENVLKVREDLTLENNISKLIEFYDKCVVGS